MKNFFNSTLWNIRAKEKSALTRGWICFLRTIVLTCRNFSRNQCPLRASALTLYTLLSLIPVAALVFAVAKGFDLEGSLKNWIVLSLKEYPIVANKLIEYSSKMLDGAKGGVIAGVGIVILVYATVSLLMQIEKAFNDVWGVQSTRPFYRKISDYLSMILLFPILIGTCASASAYAYQHFNVIGAKVLEEIPWKTELVLLWTHAFPIAAGWLIFMILFIIIPDTRVNKGPAAIGALVSSILCHLVQTLYVSAQFLVAKYNAIYGGFAAFPLFLIWIQLSWTFILLGVQISCAAQNSSYYEGAPQGEELAPLPRLLNALRILKRCATEFDAMNQPLSEEELSSELNLPIRTVRETLRMLADAGLLTEAGNGPAGKWQIGIPTEKLTLVNILRRLQENGSAEGVDVTSPAYIVLSNFWAAAAVIPQNVPLVRVNL